eukprot:4572236-Pyramimonas_sp.AAC.1
MLQAVVSHPAYAPPEVRQTLEELTFFTRRVAPSWVLEQSKWTGKVMRAVVLLQWFLYVCQPRCLLRRLF